MEGPPSPWRRAFCFWWYVPGGTLRAKLGGRFAYRALSPELSPLATNPPGEESWEMMTALDAVADLATIATAAVAVWWWFLVCRRSRNTRQALEEKLIERASKSGANDADSLTLDQMMAYLNASAAEVRDAVAQSQLV